MCNVGVAVTNESNMTSYFPEAGNVNGSNADMCSDMAGPSSSGSGGLFEFSDRSNTTDPPITNTTATIERDYNIPCCLSGRVTPLCIRSIQMMKVTAIKSVLYRNIDLYLTIFLVRMYYILV